MKLSRIKLSSLFQEDLADREMNALRGGLNCGCACDNVVKATNYNANADLGYHSPSGNIICTWSETDSSGVIVNGGSKVPGMS